MAPLLLQVYDPERQESTLTLAEWALLRGVKLAKCSASSGVLPRLNSGGLGQASLHNGAQPDLPRPPSQLDLGLLDDFLFDDDLSDPDGILFGGALGKRAASEPPAPQPTAKRPASGQPSPCSTLPGPMVQAQQEATVFEYTISPRDDGIAHMKRFGPVNMGRVLRWVVLLGGCQEVTRCRGWALVASRLGLPLEADLHIQHIYITELLHMEKQQQQRLRQVHQQHVMQHRALLNAGNPMGTELLPSQPLLLPQPSEGLLTPCQPSPGGADDDLLQACSMFSGGGMLGQPADAFLLPLGQAASGPVAAPPRAPVPALAPAAAPALQTGPPTELLQPSFLAVLPGGDSPPGSPSALLRG